MERRAAQPDREIFSCSLCNDLLKDPVTIPCGHSFCKACMEGCWDGMDPGGDYSCPQCWQSFTSRPDLVKNTTLAAAVEEPERGGEQAAAPVDACYAGAQDVACDVCSGSKLKALKSCLECGVTFCESHLQPHYVAAQYKKHQLVEPRAELQENVCSAHGEAMSMFCRSDQRCVCSACCADRHRFHEVVPAAAERERKEKDLQKDRQTLREGVSERERHVKELEREVENINRSAEEALKQNKSFLLLVRLIERGSSYAQQEITSQQEAEVRRVRELQERLEQEAAELRRRDAELQRLSRTEDHCRFLQAYPSAAASARRPPAHARPSAPRPRPPRYFEDVTAAVKEGRQKIRIVKIFKNIKWSLTQVDVLLPAEPRTREEFLRYAYDLTLDPNTADTRLLLSDNNSRVTLLLNHQSHHYHPDRFLDHFQVLSREALSGRHYWEVEWSGFALDLAVAYKKIGRAGEESKFGHNAKSWSLYCDQRGYVLRHNGQSSAVSGPRSATLGVFLDHRAGLLSFYSVAEDMRRLHALQTSFAEPLHAGLRPYGASASAVFCKLN